MMRVAILLAGGFAVTTLAQQGVPVFRTTADAVTLTASVQQRGRPIVDLTSAEFDVRDNGVRQTLSVVSLNTKAALDVDLLVDVSESMAADVLARAERAFAEIRQMFGPTDRVHVFNFASRLHSADPSHPFRKPDWYEARHTALWDSLALLLARRTDSEYRKALIVLTDALDTASFVPHDGIRAMSDRTDAMVHFVAINLPGNLAFRWAADWGVRKDEFDQYCWFLQDLADRTGGEFLAVRPDGEFATALRQAIDASRTRYVLRYEPRGVAPGGWHALTVNVTRSGRFDIRARKGYQRD